MVTATSKHRLGARSRDEAALECGAEARRWGRPRCTGRPRSSLRPSLVDLQADGVEAGLGCAHRDDEADVALTDSRDLALRSPSRCRRSSLVGAGPSSVSFVVAMLGSDVARAEPVDRSPQAVEELDRGRVREHGTKIGLVGLGVLHIARPLGQVLDYEFLPQ